jgi:hypothetical protein
MEASFSSYRVNLLCGKDKRSGPIFKPPEPAAHAAKAETDFKERERLGTQFLVDDEAESRFNGTIFYPGTPAPGKPLR